MRTLIKILICALLPLLFFSCKKKEDKATGICYCDYASGDKKQFDLRNLNRTQQVDSCNVFNKNAGPFGGVCELE